METKYDVYIYSHGFLSSREEKVTGTIKELKKTLELGSALRNSNPRTLNGLQKVLNQYAKKHSTTYTGISYEVFVSY